MITNILTIDIEEYFHSDNVAHLFGPSRWHTAPSRVVETTRFVLQLLEDHHVRATFFVLGWVAERFPDLVVEIFRRGHEIGTHGYWHKLVYEQEPHEFEEDLRQSIGAIRSALGAVDFSVQCYRAPSFSITAKSLWALDILPRCGIRYDSSIFPIAGHHRYGMPDASRFCSVFANGLTEIPLSTVRIWGLNIPVAGGGYFRMYPYFVSWLAIRRINNEGQPGVIYLHPWEFDPSPPAIAGLSTPLRFRHYAGMRRTRSRFVRLLSDFRFDSIGAVLRGMSREAQGRLARADSCRQAHATNGK